MSTHCLVCLPSSVSSSSSSSITADDDDYTTVINGDSESVSSSSDRPVLNERSHSSSSLLSCFNPMDLLFLLLLLGVVVSSLCSGGYRSSSSHSDHDTEEPKPHPLPQVRAILHREDKRASFLQRKMLSNTSVTCNDGTPAGYYVRTSPTNSPSKRWIIFLEGGWHCFSQLSCRQRWTRARQLMTSAHWPQIRSMGGILSTDPLENPFWWNANHVLLPYCSSDVWSGDSHPARPGDFSFLGSRIIDSVIRELIRDRGLGEADLLLLTGSSAGAAGVLVNLDRVSDLVTSLTGGRVKVKGVADSGWFLDNKPFDDSIHDDHRHHHQTEHTGNDVFHRCHSSPHSCPPVETIKLGIKLWGGILPSSCLSHYPDEPWKCYFGYRIYPTLKTPLFVVQWIFDEAQMMVDNVGTPVTRAQWNYIHNLGQELRRSLENVTALFAPSCVSHTFLTKRSWSETTINGISLPSALHCWEEQQIDSHNNNILTTTTPQPTTTLPLLTGDYLSITRDDTNVSFDYSTLPEKRKRHHHHHSHSISSSSPSPSGSPISRGSLGDILQSDQPLNPVMMSSQTMSPSKGGERQMTHVRLVEEKSIRKKKRRRKHRNRGHNRRFRGILESDGKPVTVINQPKIVSKEKSGETCRVHLMDSCSWPQCNRSCPRLYNPFTGKEMDFIQLFKTLGLDMTEVASALGVDSHALSRMDHDSLMKMLTQ